MVHEGKRHKCSICDKTYATKAILETHVASVHEKSNAFKCTICGATFTTKGTLKYHTQNIHEKPESKSNSENYEINHVELGGHFMSDSTLLLLYPKQCGPQFAWCLDENCVCVWGIVFKRHS